MRYGFVQAVQPELINDRARTEQCQGRICEEEGRDSRSRPYHSLPIELCLHQSPGRFAEKLVYFVTQRFLERLLPICSVLRELLQIRRDPRITPVNKSINLWRRSANCWPTSLSGSSPRAIAASTSRTKSAQPRSDSACTSGVRRLPKSLRWSWV